MTAILGVSAFYHDSAASLVIDGQVVSAAQEERFTRKKHDADFPRHAVEYCLREGRLSTRDLDYVVFFEKPFVNSRAGVRRHVDRRVDDSSKARLPSADQVVSAA